jgi:sugar/nucleoside kinase (ribokinase family)
VSVSDAPPAGDLALFRGTRLCVVGNVNRDVKLAPIDPGPHLFADGETSTAAVRETVGGGGANSSLAAAALGADVSFVGKVGGDRLGHRLWLTFAAHGVRHHLVRDPDHLTGTSVNLVWTTGHRHFVSCLPTATTLAFHEFDAAAILTGHHHLLRADPWFSEPMLLDGGNRKLFAAARDAGLAVSLDINWDPQWGWAPSDVVEGRKQALRDTLPLVDLAHGNVRELCAFTDASDLDDALARLERWGVGAVVVHMGEQGAAFYADGTLTTEPSVPADRVVNTTGTGDVLSVCVMLLHARPDMPVRDKLRLANTVVAEYIAGRRDLVPELLD